MKLHRDALRDALRGKWARMFGIIALATSLFGAMLAPQSTSAQIGGWRGDPIVHLTNGDQVKVAAFVADSQEDVLQVVYTLHVPAGDTMLGVTYTNGDKPGIESFQVIADNPPGVFDTDTVVTTGLANIAVTARTSVPSVGTDSVTGTSGQDLLVHIEG